MVETALVMSLFLGLVLGIVTVGYLIFTFNSLAFMAQQGARWAAVRGSASGHPADAAAVQTYVLTQGVGLSKTAVDVQTTWIPDKNPGSTVKLTITYSASPFVSTLLPKTMTMRSVSVAMITR